ncbi:MAG: hypothetical protein EBE86_019165 [Hormoscilla sp. GUM202]|nr:hypothetical protein [Hormoscilla sp. GUM202]
MPSAKIPPKTKPRPWIPHLMLPWAITIALAMPVPARPLSTSPSNQSSAITLRSDIQEANAKTGVVTARGNVQILYPAREIRAAAAQAQYFSRERRIVLTGNVSVIQSGNSLQAEIVTYLIDEGRFIAQPLENSQVLSIYIVPEAEATDSTAIPRLNLPSNQP